MAPATAETLVAARVDSKGRVMLPQRTRKQLDVKPGDLVVMAVDETTHTLRVAKVVSPLEVLAVEALALDARGETIGDRELVESLELDPDAEPLEITDPE
jgi:bifunctional DNA-binding transcriptional regulator/antitoxin component of YhaV-PrlF toxin-antitoxin module